jgi:hypothetical protein
MLANLVDQRQPSDRRVKQPGRQARQAVKLLLRTSRPQPTLRQSGQAIAIGHIVSAVTVAGTERVQRGHTPTIGRLPALSRALDKCSMTGGPAQNPSCG